MVVDRGRGEVLVVMERALPVEHIAAQTGGFYIPYRSLKSGQGSQNRVGSLNERATHDIHETGGSLSDTPRWTACEGALNQHILRVYDLTPTTVRVDGTTASGYWEVTEDGLFQFGHSKDHRPDLPQVKVMLATLYGGPLCQDTKASSFPFGCLLSPGKTLDTGGRWRGRGQTAPAGAVWPRPRRKIAERIPGCLQPRYTWYGRRLSSA